MADHQRPDARVEAVDICTAVVRLYTDAPFITATYARINDGQDQLGVGIGGVAVAKGLKEDVECHWHSLPSERCVSSSLAAKCALVRNSSPIA
jgi:hypothetical protein